MGQYFLTASAQRLEYNSPISRAADVAMFWRQSSRFWFEKNPAFDTFFKEQFAELYGEIVDRRHENWLADPDGALALILMTDQYPRNAYRGSGRMYSSDAQAIQYARTALKAGYPAMVEARLQLFFYLPFSHSEDIADQRISVSFTARLGNPWEAQARQYMNIISRFGRFPHRNEILGRTSTKEEEAFLQSQSAGA